MSVITISATDVIPGASATVDELEAGEVIAAGDLVCNIDGVAYKADADHATPARAVVAGMATNSALAIGQPVFVQKNSTITVGAVLEKGLPYFLSQTAGKMCLAADLGAGSRPCLVGFAATTSTLTIGVKASSVQYAAQVNIATTVGGGSTNEIQSVEVRYATGGTFTLTYDGQTTGNIAYNANAAAIEAALEALSNITAVSVSGAGTLASPFLVTFEDGTTNVPQMTATITNLLPA
jgi:hypothetical protein